MKKIIIVFLLIISDIAYASNFVVNKIYFDGLYRISVDTMLYTVSFKLGDTVSTNSIANSIRTLFFTGFFEDISVSKNDNGVITVVVKENPIIDSIDFYGNKIIKREIIQKILDTKKIKIGEFLNRYAIFETNQKLRDIYYDVGKLHATVNIVTTLISQNKVKLKFIFSEGDTTKINQIKIFGNRQFSQKKLLHQFESYKKKSWYNILRNKQFQKQVLFHDLDKLRSFYVNHGYAKFRIDETYFELTSDEKNINFSIYLAEGVQFSLKSIIISGNVLNYISNIYQYLNFIPGELYNENKIKNIEYNIRYILGQYGYIHPEISIEYDFDDRNKTIQLYMYIDVGTCFYVREIQIEGNNFTKDAIIRREIQQLEQSPLNYVNVLNDQKRLLNFSYFKKVDTYIKNNVSYILNQVDVIYKIEERNTGNLNFSLGMGIESGLNMQISVNQDNVLGTGNLISVTAIKNQYHTYIDTLILKRYGGINKNSISGQIFYNKIFTDKVRLSNYNMKNYGMNINYTCPINESNSYNIGLNYVNNYLSNIEPQVSIWRYLYSIGINPDLLVDKKNNSMRFYINDLLLVSGWSINNLNNLYFPDSGFCINVTNKFTLPVSNNNYYKIIIDNDCYLRLDKYSHWVLMSSMYAGYAGGLYTNKENPFYDNFHIGGIGTLRGFQLNSIGPRAAYYRCSDPISSYSQCAIENSQDTVGGNAVVLMKNELIIPIACLKDTQYSDTMRIALFIDAGTVWDTYWKNTLETRAANILDYSIFGHIRISTGLSIKWISPIGPIIFSYSKLIKKYSGDVEEPFQFTIGKTW